MGCSRYQPSGMGVAARARAKRGSLEVEPPVGSKTMIRE